MIHACLDLKAITKTVILFDDVLLNDIWIRFP